MKLYRHSRVSPELADAVRSFVASVPEQQGACHEMDPRWLVTLHRGLAHQPSLLVAEQDGAIAGVLPLAGVRSVIFGRFLVSLPYLNRAGIAFADSTAAKRLWSAAIDDSRDMGAKYLELRHHAYVHDVNAGSVQNRDDKQRMVLELPADADSLWTGLNAKVRNQVRKGDKSELEIRWGGEDLLDAFYHVFSINMRDLGTPVYPRKLFAAMLDQFAGQAELAVVIHRDQAVAGAVVVHDDWTGQQLTQVPSASCLRSANATCANMWMYHRLLVRAIERGSTRFDFGRSSEGSGTWRFKKQWGAVPHPTVWQIVEQRGQADAVRPDNPKYQRRIQTWQRLPVWLTKAVGPPIVRGIP